MWGLCIYKNHTSVAEYMIQLTFVAIRFIQFVHMYKKHAKAVSGCYFNCIGFVYTVCTVCLYKKQTFQVWSRFWSELCTSFIQFRIFFFCIDVGIWYFFIIQSFDLYNLCIQNMYKFNVLYNFGIHFVQFLYKFFGKGGYKIRTFGRNELTTKYNKLIWTCLDLLTFKRIIWL